MCTEYGFVYFSFLVTHKKEYWAKVPASPQGWIHGLKSSWAWPFPNNKNFQSTIAYFLNLPVNHMVSMRDIELISTSAYLFLLHSIQLNFYFMISLTKDHLRRKYTKNIFQMLKCGLLMYFITMCCYVHYYDGCVLLHTILCAQNANMQHILWTSMKIVIFITLASSRLWRLFFTLCQKIYLAILDMLVHVLTPSHFMYTCKKSSNHYRWEMIIAVTTLCMSSDSF